MRMKLDEAIAKAVDEQNGLLAGEICDRLRFRAGLNYFEVLARVRQVRPELTEAEWETLMYATDYE